MEQRQQKAVTILKYGKRRFDGGNEAELIRTIERQQEVEQFNRLYYPEHAGSAGMSFSAPLSISPLTVQQTPEMSQPAPQPATRFSRFGEIALRGPLQICIGLVGLLTTGLAIVTFHRAQNHMMVAQSRAVFQDCLRTLQQGLWDTLMTPVRLVRAAMQKTA